MALLEIVSSVVAWSVIWFLMVLWRISDRVSESNLVPSINRTKTFFEMESSVVILSETLVKRLAEIVSEIVAWSVIGVLVVPWRISDRVSESNLVPSINRTKTFFEMESSVVILSDMV